MPSGRHPELLARRVHRAPPRRHPPPPVPRVALNWEVGSVRDAAAVAALRANLHELAADFHDLAASIHESRAEEHVQAVLHSLGGDPTHHQLQADLRRTAAAAERASAQKERARARTVVRLSKIADGARGDPRPEYAEPRDEGDIAGVRGLSGGGDQRRDDSDAPAPDVASTG